MIDSVAKYLTGLIEPAEKHLELQEKFIEIQQQNKRIQLKADRTELLLLYKDVIDPNSIQLDLITDEAFTTILNGAKFAQDNKKAEALKAEEERKETARKEALFQERRFKVVELKQFYDAKKDLILTTETNQSDFDSLMKDLIFRKEENLKAQLKLAKENEALKKQNEKKEQEIKQLKEEAKQTPTPAPIPAPIPKPIKQSTQTIQPDSFAKEQYWEAHKVSEVIETKDTDIIMVSRSEYELLQKRYDIAKTALQSVLFFIVPQNLRDLVNKAIVDIGEAKKY